MIEILEYTLPVSKQSGTTEELLELFDQFGYKWDQRDAEFLYQLIDCKDDVPPSVLVIMKNVFGLESGPHEHE